MNKVAIEAEIKTAKANQEASTKDAESKKTQEESAKTSAEESKTRTQRAEHDTQQANTVLNAYALLFSCSHSSVYRN